MRTTDLICVLVLSLSLPVSGAGTTPVTLRVNTSHCPNNARGAVLDAGGSFSASSHIPSLGRCIWCRNRSPVPEHSLNISPYPRE